MEKKKNPGSTPRRRASDVATSGVRRAGARASAGMRRAAAAVKRARTWSSGRERETIPVSTIPPLPPAAGEESADPLVELEEAVKRHPVGSLAAAALAGYVVGRLLD